MAADHRAAAEREFITRARAIESFGERVAARSQTTVVFTHCRIAQTIIQFQCGRFHFQCGTEVFRISAK